MTTKINIKGVIPATITIFSEDGNIDEEALADHVDFLIKNGVNGLFCLGTYGEGPLMTTEERKEAIRIIVEANHGRIPIIAHIGAITTKETIELCKYSTNVGVTAVSVVPPWYYRHDENAIISHYKAVASVTDVPVFVYNNPARTGINITPDLLAKLAQIDNLLGIKDSSESLLQFCENMRIIKKQNFVHIFGSDDQALAGLVMGAAGIIVGLANVFPQFHVNLYKEFLNGNYLKARELQLKIIEIRNILKKGPYISIVHEVINMLGRKGGFAKRPLRPATEEEKKVVKEGLKSLGLI